MTRKYWPSEGYTPVPDYSGLLSGMQLGDPLAVAGSIVPMGYSGSYGIPDAGYNSTVTSQPVAAPAVTSTPQTGIGSGYAASTSVANPYGSLAPFDPSVAGTNPFGFGNSLSFDPSTASGAPTGLAPPVASNPYGGIAPFDPSVAGTNPFGYGNALSFDPNTASTTAPLTAGTPNPYGSLGTFDQNTASTSPYGGAPSFDETTASTIAPPANSTPAYAAPDVPSNTQAQQAIDQAMSSANSVVGNPMSLGSSAPSFMSAPSYSEPTTLGTNQPISPNNITTPLGAVLSPEQQSQLALMGALEGPNQAMQYGVMDNRGFVSGLNPATEASKPNQTALNTPSVSETPRTPEQLQQAQQNLSSWAFNNTPLAASGPNMNWSGNGVTNTPSHPSASLGQQVEDLATIDKTIAPPSTSYSMPSMPAGTMGPMAGNISYSGPSVEDLPSANGVIGQSPSQPGPESPLASPFANGLGDLNGGYGNPDQPGPENSFGISPASAGPESQDFSGPAAPGPDTSADANGPMSPGPEGSPVSEAMTADIASGLGEATSGQSPSGNSSSESGTLSSSSGDTESGISGGPTNDNSGQSGPNIGSISSDSVSTGIGSDNSVDSTNSGYGVTGTPDDSGTPVADNSGISDSSSSDVASADASSSGTDVSSSDDSSSGDSAFAARGGFIEHALKVSRKSLGAHHV